MIVEGMPKVGNHNSMDFYIVGRLGKHTAAYVKVRYKQKWASILIEDPETAYNYGIPTNKLKEAQEWVLLNQSKLKEYWSKVRTAMGSFHGLSLEKVTATDDYKLYCTFSNGEKLVIDFTPFKRDFPDFLGVKLQDGIPTWPSGFDLDPDELYELGSPYQVAAGF